MKWIFIFLSLYIPSLLQASIVYESGSLSGFMLGSSSGSSYDNWISHVTEGIASEDYNDYGPEWLDVQTNGFGNQFRATCSFHHQILLLDQPYPQHISLTHLDQV